MSRFAVLAIALASSLALAPAAVGAHARQADFQPRRGARTLLFFDAMFGVDGAFVGDEHPVDGIPGDELPWEIDAVVGRLDTAGNLFLLIKGLVFKDDPSVPEDLRGINDEEEFRAAVACLTEEGGQVVQRNVVTSGFPATRSGNSVIHAHVDLPDPCIAPAVLVLAGSEDKWFSVTGFETED